MTEYLTKQIASKAAIACAGTAVLGAMTGSFPVLAAAVGLASAAAAANMAAETSSAGVTALDSRDRDFRSSLGR